MADPRLIAEEKPDVLLVLAWNFFDEISRQLEGYTKAGGRLVLPVEPRPRLQK